MAKAKPSEDYAVWFTFADARKRAWTVVLSAPPIVYAGDPCDGLTDTKARLILIDAALSRAE